MTKSRKRLTRTLVDSVLVTAAEGTHDERAGVGGSGVNWKSVALFSDLDDAVYIGEVEVAWDALGIEV